MTPLTIIAGLVLITATQQEVKKPAATSEDTTDAAIVQEQLPSYPMVTCLISGELLGGEMGPPIEFVHEGRLVRLCCTSCKKVFQKDSAEYLKELDAAVVAAQVASYPLQTCPVSGEKLGSMGDPIEYVTGTRLIRLCCKGCVSKVARDPATYLAKVDRALIEQQLKTYPLDTCLMSGEALAEPVDHLHGTRLVRFCCPLCVKAFRKDPAKALAKLDEARKEKDTAREQSADRLKKGQ